MCAWPKAQQPQIPRLLHVCTVVNRFAVALVPVFRQDGLSARVPSRPLAHWALWPLFQQLGFQMEQYNILIDAAVAQASPVLARMRLDGLDRSPLPFAERYVQAWRGAPEPDMSSETLMNVLKVRGASATCWRCPNWRCTMCLVGASACRSTHAPDLLDSYKLRSFSMSSTSDNQKLALTGRL